MMFKSGYFELPIHKSVFSTKKTRPNSRFDVETASLKNFVIKSVFLELPIKEGDSDA